MSQGLLSPWTFPCPFHRAYQNNNYILTIVISWLVTISLTWSRAPWYNVAPILIETQSISHMWWMCEFRQMTLLRTAVWYFFPRNLCCIDYFWQEWLNLKYGFNSKHLVGTRCVVNRNVTAPRYLPPLMTFATLSIWKTSWAMWVHSIKEYINPVKKLLKYMWVISSVQTHTCTYARTVM